jgi:hypothetical protein
VNGYFKLEQIIAEAKEALKTKVGTTMKKKKKKKKEHSESPESVARKEKFAEDLAKALFPDIRPVPRTEEEFKEAVVNLSFFSFWNVHILIFVR